MSTAESAPDLAEVVRANDLDVHSLLERVEESVLGGPRKYTSAQVAERSGFARDKSRGLWQSLGFAAVEDDAAVFTESDLDALELVRELQAYGFEDDALVSAMTRLFGQTFSRLASWQGQLLLQALADNVELISSEDAVVEMIERIGPVMERLQAYAWRRQLVAYFARVASRAEGDVAKPLDYPLAIGFVDMSGFTSLTRGLTEAELRALLDAFESSATDIVGRHGGRIIKTIGDEVLFQAESAASAAQIALELVEVGATDPQLPELRAGLAYGPVVSRLGDVYGSTVNIASRLTSIGRPGWVLVDREMHEALAGDERFSLRPRRPASVRGFHHLHPWRLRRSSR